MPRQTSLVVALGFGNVALFLSALGIYGVLAYLMAQRHREIGIRITIGGSASNMFRLVLQKGLLLIGVGLALKLAGSVVVRRALETQVYGVAPLDPLVVRTVAVVLDGIAIAACALPTRHAAS